MSRKGSGIVPGVAAGVLGVLVFAGPGCVKGDPALGPLAQALLQVAAEANGSAGAADPEREREVRRELGILARRVAEVRARARARRGAADVDADLAAMSQALFAESAFVREVTSTDLGFVLLPSVLASRKGSCVGLGTLYLVLAERLGIPLEGVVVPGHFFVRARTPDGQIRNAETLRQGEVMPDSFYRDKYNLAERAARAHLRALSVREIVAVVRFNVGNERRRQGRLAEAADFYQRAADEFPDFGEAHASLGLTRQLQGQWEAARAAYRAAGRAEPNLPGLKQNVALLEAEIAGSRQPSGGAP